MEFCKDYQSGILTSGVGEKIRIVGVICLSVSPVSKSFSSVFLGDNRIKKQFRFSDRLILVGYALFIGNFTEGPQAYN